MNKYLKIIFGASVLGWANALYTLYHRQSLYAQGLTRPSFCNMGASLNCDAVALSTWSSFAGMPTSALGLVFYSFFIFLSLWGMVRLLDHKEAGTEILSPLFLIVSGLTLFPTFLLAFISATQLKTFCLMCLLTYSINLVLFVISYLYFRSQKAPMGALKTFSIPTSLVWIFIASIALHLFLPAVLSNSLHSGEALSEVKIKAYLSQYAQGPALNPVTEGRPFKGSADAKVTLVVFSDFQCPFCGREALTTPQVLKQYEKSVKLIFKNFPLDSSCNPLIENGGPHPLACLAAKSAYCVFKLKGNDRFFEVKEQYFLNQEKLSPELIKNKALMSGLSEPELSSCVNDMATHQFILDDINDANRVKVQGTPTGFLNGRRFEGLSYPEVLQAAIERELAK